MQKKLDAKKMFEKPVNVKIDENSFYENGFTGSDVSRLKNILIDELNELMKDFQIRKNSLDKKLANIEKEKEMYDKAINLISSLKNI